MPRGSSKYGHDPYAAFVEDVRRAYERARHYNGRMNEDEWVICEAVHDALLTNDPHAAGVDPPRNPQKTNLYDVPSLRDVR